MKRREALRKASLILGYSITAPAIIGVLNGCRPDTRIGIDPNWKPQFLQEDQVDAMVALVNTIIPKTDSPAASEVGVVEFLDSMMANILKPESTTLFTEGMTRLTQLSGDKSFDKLSEEERVTALTALEKEQLPMVNEKGPNKVFYTALRGLVVTGYMLSEEIGLNHLAYDPIPGPYEGCVPLEVSGGVNWTLTR